MEEKEAKKRALEEEARQNRTTTTAADYKNTKKCTPIIRLKNETLCIVLKNFTCMGIDTFSERLSCFSITKEIEIEVKRNIAQGIIFEGEQVLG